MERRDLKEKLLTNEFLEYPYDMIKYTMRNTWGEHGPGDLFTKEDIKDLVLAGVMACPGEYGAYNFIPEQFSYLRNDIDIMLASRTENASGIVIHDADEIQQKIKDLLAIKEYISYKYPDFESHEKENILDAFEEIWHICESNNISFNKLDADEKGRIADTSIEDHFNLEEPKDHNDPSFDKHEVYFEINEAIVDAESIDELNELAFAVCNSLTHDSITHDEFKDLLENISLCSSCSAEMEKCINEELSNNNSLPLNTYLWKNVPAFKEDIIDFKKDYIINHLIDNGVHNLPETALENAKIKITKEKEIIFSTDIEYGINELTGQKDTEHYEGKITCDLPGEIDLVIKELEKITPLTIEDGRNDGFEI